MYLLIKRIILLQTVIWPVQHFKILLTLRIFLSSLRTLMISSLLFCHGDGNQDGCTGHLWEEMLPWRHLESARLLHCVGGVSPEMTFFFKNKCEFMYYLILTLNVLPNLSNNLHLNTLHNYSNVWHQQLFKIHSYFQTCLILVMKPWNTFKVLLKNLHEALFLPVTVHIMFFLNPFLICQFPILCLMKKNIFFHVTQ